MSDWVRLDARGITSPQHEKLHGVDITLIISPYDIPEAIRGEYNKDLKKFIIEFRYMNEEPWLNHRYNESIVLRIGRHSMRLYGIEVDLNALPDARINLRMNVAKAVADAMDGLAHHPGIARRRRNYEIAKDAIYEKQGQIFESLAPA